MALQSNYDEILQIVEECHQKYNAYLSEIRTPFWGGYLLKFKDELLSQESIASLQNRLNEMPYKISHTLKFQDVAVLENEAPLENCSKKDSLHFVDMAEDYYDLRIDSQGGLHWNGDMAKEAYKESMNYSAIYENKLLELTKNEVNQNKLDLTDADKASLLAAERKGKNSHINLDCVCCSKDYMEISGWAGCSDVNSKTTIPVIVIGEKGKLNQYHAYVGKKFQREDVSIAFGENYMESGFKFLVDLNDFRSKKVGRIFYYDVEKECFHFECKDYLVYESGKLIVRKRYAV